jgi:hypothetical protein
VPLAPLPQAGLPKDQIVEGAVQVRLSSAGLTTLNEFAGEIIRTLLGEGVCLPRTTGTFSVIGIQTTVRICEETDQCGGGMQGCRITASVGSTTLNAPSAQLLRLAARNVTGNASTTVRAAVDLGLFTVNLSCRVNLKIKKLDLEADVNVGTHESTGGLNVGLADLRTLNIDVDLGGCTAAQLAGLVIDGLELIINTRLGTAIANLVRPFINDAIQSVLPNPLGLEGALDLGSLLGNVLPGLAGRLEVSAIPGGYLTAPNEGISVGVMVGLNADRDTSTRDPDTDTEPARCVPAWPAPNLQPKLGAANARGHFVVPPVGGFLGEENFGADVAIGISETVLDQAGYHLLASGALCLAVDSSFAPQLNLGTVGILVRSLSSLGTGKEPVLLQIRPTVPLDFDIVEGEDGPLVAAKIQGMEVDFYAYVFERYVRAFTISITAELRVGLEYMPDEDGNPVLIPIIEGLDSDAITVDISNTEFLRETPEQLEAVFPTILNLVIPLIGSAIPEIAVPAVFGFTLGDLRMQRVITSSDKFLAVFASIARAPTLIVSKQAPPSLERVTPTATLSRVANPAPERIWDAVVAKQASGKLPEIELALGGSDAEGRPLEWQWRLDRTMWRPFSDDPTLVIRDPSLALQGKHVVEIRARAIGAPETTSLDVVTVPVTIDSLAPRVVADQARRQGDQVLVPAVDAVHDDQELLYALGRPGDQEPRGEWNATDGWFRVSDLQRFSDDGRVRVFARDPLGNAGSAVVDLLTLGETAGGGCSVAPGGGRGDLLPFLFVFLVAAAFRARRRLAGLLLALGLAACSGTKGSTVECEVDVDCQEKCPAGELGLCFENTCSCTDDIPLGDVGAYSDMALAQSGEVWVSAYNDRHGDLMVAQAAGTGRITDDRWQFIDGVPDGPVVLEDSEVRGGIAAPGDDVGLYTSIAVTPTGPMVAYYDRTHGSLRLATKSGETWERFTVDAGAPANSAPSRDVGRYASITLDPMGRPGIAYLAIIRENADVQRTEVRFAQATTTTPRTASDWQVSVVDTQPMPKETETDLLLEDAPRLVGLFITSARKADGAPVVAFYDRVNGALRVSISNGSAFAPPVVIDREGGDVGWSPSVSVAGDVVSVSYRDVSSGALLVQALPDGQAEIVDDGYRTEGTTAGGLPRPVLHRIGEDSVLVQAGGRSAVVYQDATTHEIIVAVRSAQLGWDRTTIAGAEETFVGAYGFHAAARLSGEDLFISSYVLDLGESDQWVEVFRTPLFIE